MTRLLITELRLALLLVPILCSSGVSHSQSAAGFVSEGEIAKQRAIYQSRGDSRPEGYVVDRSLLSYSYTLPDAFNRSIADLRSNDRWLDIGAGEGRAILDYHASKYDAMHFNGRERHGEKAKAVAISIEDRRTVHWHLAAEGLEPAQIRYLFGKPLRDYSLEELGRFQVITDLLGGFSYTRNLSVFMEKALGFLEPDGSFYTMLQDVRGENATNRPHYPDASYLTEIVKGDGSQTSVCSWLKSIGCAEVTCELRAEWNPPIAVYRIQKICEKVTVPTLVPIHFEAGTPPERRFRWGGPPASTAARKP